MTRFALCHSCSRSRKLRANEPVKGLKCPWCFSRNVSVVAPRLAAEVERVGGKKK